ncbi:MAG: C-terminal target protein [Ignavibacteria bacterium]|nr:C-terminal target protein [Ignavibacteria bacterium]
MKFLYSMLVLTIFIFYQSANAQLTTPFKASEGLASAKTEAAKTISNPQLIFVGTMKGVLQGLPVTISFDIDNGNANVWIYIFRSNTNPDSTQTIMVLKIVLFNASQFPGNFDLFKQFGIDKNTNLEPFTWIDSDKPGAEVKKNSKYTTFVAAHPNYDQMFFGLFQNSYRPELIKGQPYWGISVVDKNLAQNCAVHAVNKTVSCLDVTGVEDEFHNVKIPTLYPNPASGIMTLELPIESMNKPLNASIYNYVGNKVTEIMIENVTTNLNVEKLSPGCYYLKIEGSGDSQILQFFITK